MRILLVEDHEDTGQAFVRLLHGKGHDVKAVSYAADALRLCQEETFDLLISDLGLPDFDGWKLLERVRQICPIPAIALSGFGQRQDISRSMKAGFDAHLTKPVNFEKLCTTIDVVLRKRA